MMTERHSEIDITIVYAPPITFRCEPHLLMAFQPGSELDGDFASETDVNDTRGKLCRHKLL